MLKNKTASLPKGERGRNLLKKKKLMKNTLLVTN